jgi:hypothetical protein
MITATLQGEQIWLPADFSIEIVRQGNIPVRNEISGDYAPQINIPAVPINNVRLNHPNRFSIRNNEVREYPGFQILFRGSLKLSGTLVINDYSDGNYTGYVRGNVGELSQKQKQKSIRDFEYSKQLRTFTKKSTYNQAVDDYCTPEVVNNDFFNNFGYSVEREVDDEAIQTTSFNEWFYNNAESIVNKNDASGAIYSTIQFYASSQDQVSINVVSPYLFLFNLVNNLIKEENFQIVRNDITSDADLAKIILYNNFDITKTSIVNQTGRANQSSRRGSTINTAWVELLKREIAGFKYSDLLPEMSFNSLLVSIQNLLNYIINIDPLHRVSIIDRETIFDETADDLDQYLVGEFALGAKKDVTLKFSIKKDDTDSATGDIEDFDIKDRIDDFIEPEPTIDGLRTRSVITGEPGQLMIVEDTGQIFEYKLTINDNAEQQTGIHRVTAGWVYVGTILTSGYYNLKAGNEVESIETDFGAIMADGERPFVSQPGSGNDRLVTYKQFNGRVLFYNGGTSCSQSSNNYTLSYLGEKGMINTRWQRTAEWWCHRQPVRCEMDLPEHILKGFNINRKKRTRHGEFVIEKMVTKYSHYSVSKTQIEGYKA